MKQITAAVTIIVLFAVYIVNVSITMASLKTVPSQRVHLQPPSPPKKDAVRKILKNHVNASSLQLPIYTKEMAAQAIHPAPWSCYASDDPTIVPFTEQRQLFAFVHIYKTAGSTLRNFFKYYSLICRKGWMLLISCTKAKPSSIKSVGDEVKNWEPCKVKNVVDRNRFTEWDGMDERVYKSVNNTVLRENIDIVGGHFRMGTGDFIFESNTSNKIHPIRHIIFLRDPMERFVSGILYERKGDEQDTLQSVVKLIKKRVTGSRAANDYWDRSLNYLLTPTQAEEFESKTVTQSHNDKLAQARAMLAINNLVKYNVIVGMTERMYESMQILKHILLANASEKKRSRLAHYTEDATHNESKKGEVSTLSVLNELKQDTEFMPVFEEYVKYEKIINEYAMKMHLMQHEALKKQSVLGQHS